MDINNSIEAYIRELRRNDKISLEYVDIYKNYISNEKLVTIFSSIHALLNSGFVSMNSRLPTFDYEAHFWAQPSRELLYAIDIADRVMRTLKSSQYSFSYDDYNAEIIKKCKEFLSPSGGSLIPKNFEKIELYYTIPIFKFNNTIETDHNPNKAYQLHHKGGGSYAEVFVYHDEYYDTKFAVKKAHKDLSNKELVRFKQEFNVMKSLRSPYILNVFTYNNDKNQYVMEYMDITLYDYIKENNAKLSIDTRKNIVLQTLRAFSYLHSQNVLHRDISPSNVLLKLYDDVIVVKISDFGLVKMPESTMTSVTSDIKGSFNDPALVIEGFNNYSIEHEIYALTRLVLFILSGKLNLDNIKNPSLIMFVNKGTDPIKDNRYKNVDELRVAFLEALTDMKK